MRLIAIVLLTAASAVFAKDRPPTWYIDPCKCQGDHGEDRWKAKTQAASPPANSAAIQTMTPSQIYEWAPLAGLNDNSPRKAPEEIRWVRVTGRVVDVRAQVDGDVHFLLRDVSGSKRGMFLAEVPLGKRWCGLRKTVFAWTKKGWQFAKFQAPTGNILKKERIVTVTGRVFFDTHHAQKKPSLMNRNVTDKSGRTAAWEIHPVSQVDETMEVRRALPVVRSPR